MRPKNWLNEADEIRISQLANKVSDLWKSGPDPRAYTPHDPGHFARVEHNLRCLIPANSWDQLTESERFVLTCAAWTHDVAMHPDAHGPSGKKLKPQQIRDLHVDESANWVIRERRKLNLAFAEAAVIAEVNRFHSRSKADISLCSGQRICKGEFVRPRLLAAYLRLADAIEVAHERVDDWELSRFLFLQEAVTETADLTLFHWIKSFVVSGITPSVVSQTIQVEFQAPRRDLLELLKKDLPQDSRSSFESRNSLPLDLAERSSGFRMLTHYILDEVRNELETVEEILACGGITSFHFVKPAPDVILLAGDAEPVWAPGLRRVVNYMRVAYSPNSTGTAEAALTAVDDAIDVIKDLAKKAFQKSPTTETVSDKQVPDGEWNGEIPRGIVKEVFPQLRESLQARLEVRSCQNELRRISNFVVRLATHIIQDRRADCRPWIAELKDYRRRMENLIRSDGEATKRLCKVFWSTVKKELPARKKTKRLTVLLFGNSSTVAKTIAKFAEYGGENLFCYIAEGRPKTHHGARNVPLYVDAEAYATAIREAVAHSPGKLKVDIKVIPDAAVGTVLDPFHAKGRDQSKCPPVDMVLFGANSIFSNPEVRVAHTSGHLAIAATARQFKVPVFVIAGAVKVQTRPPATKWRDAVRSNNWLASRGSGLIERLAEQGATADWNPREDQIPFGLLTAIITELGICAPNKGDARRKLDTWQKRIDTQVGQDRDFNTNEDWNEQPNLTVPRGVK
jgi:translation initiation factor 2B subunit (eIF-2B alpha/beta/delta family)